MKTIAIAAMMLLSAATIALADDRTSPTPGVTLYGWADINATYQTHGEQVNTAYPVGVDYLIVGAKNANKPTFSVSQNGINGSRIGVFGSKAIAGDWAGVVKLESEFNPLSGKFQDGLKSMVQQNGIPLAQQKTAWGDSNKAGQFLNGNAWFGVSNPIFGSFTAGRQTSLLWDDIVKYDPNRGALAFSLVGYSGAPSGGGDTENRYMDNTLRYAIQHGPVHGYVQYGVGEGTAEGRSIQVDFGIDLGPLSIAALYSNVKDAVSASPLTTNATGALSTAQAAALAFGGFSESNTLAATISDNKAGLINGLYRVGKFELGLGYERITYANPSEALSTKGFVDGLGVGQTIGDYNIITNNAAFPRDKVLQIAWGGARYHLTPKWEVDATYYYEAQNNYSNSAALAGCSSATLSGQCSGNFYGVGVMSEYKFTRNFELYGGATWSQVTGGVANGYLQTSDFEPTLGMRLSF